MVKIREGVTKVSLGPLVPDITTCPTKGGCMQRAYTTNYLIHANARTPNWRHPNGDWKLEELFDSNDKCQVVGFKTGVACSDANSKVKMKASKVVY